MSDRSSPSMALLIAESDSQLRHLFQVLLRPYYAVIEAPNTALALETLRAHSAPLVVVWDLWLSFIAAPHVLDAIEREPALRRHAFILLAADPEAFSPALRRRAQRLSISMLSMPFEVDTFLEQVARAQERAAAPHQVAD